MKQGRGERENSMKEEKGDNKRSDKVKRREKNSLS